MPTKGAGRQDGRLDRAVDLRGREPRYDPHLIRILLALENTRHEVVVGHGPTQRELLTSGWSPSWEVGQFWRIGWRSVNQDARRHARFWFYSQRPTRTREIKRPLAPSARWFAIALAVVWTRCDRSGHTSERYRGRLVGGEAPRRRDRSESADRLVGEYQEGTTLFHISDDEQKGFVEALDDCPEDLRRLWASLEDPLAT